MQNLLMGFCFHFRGVPSLLFVLVKEILGVIKSVVEVEFELP